MAIPVRDRTETLGRLAELHPRLQAHGVVSLLLFGSAGRDAMDTASDVDLLVEFVRPVGAFEFLDLQELLADALGRPVDLVTPAAVKPWMRERVVSEAVRAARLGDRNAQRGAAAGTASSHRVATRKGNRPAR